MTHNRFENDRNRLFSHRTTIQVKTHAQMVIKRIDMGEDVFADLDICDDIEPKESTPSVFDLTSSDESSSFVPKTFDISSAPTWITDTQDVDAARVLTFLRLGITCGEVGGATSLMRQVTQDEFSSSHATLP